MSTPSRGAQNKELTQYAATYFISLAVVVVLPLLTMVIGSLAEAEFQSRMPITHSLTEEVKALRSTAPPVIDMHLMWAVVSVIVAAGVILCLLISLCYPPGVRNSKALGWISGAAFGLSAVMVLVDGIAMIVYWYLVPLLMVLGLTLLTLNFVRKTKQS